MAENENKIPLLDCPVDYLLGDASGKLMNEYGRFPCKIKCGVFALMVRGSAHATIDITQYEFKENDMLLLEPDSFLLIHKFSEDALIYYVLFSSSFLEKNMFSKQMSLTSLKLNEPILHLNDVQSKIFKDAYNLLNFAISNDSGIISSEIMIHLYRVLLQSYLQIAHRTDDVVIKPIDRRTEIYQNYCRMVLEHYQEWHHVSDYADAMHITLPHLCSTVKAVSERTAGDIIIEAILTDAKSQLKITNLQVKEIAASLGFDNVAFFNRFFKTHVGVTPKTYRLN